MMDFYPPEGEFINIILIHHLTFSIIEDFQLNFYFFARGVYLINI